LIKERGGFPRVIPLVQGGEVGRILITIKKVVDVVVWSLAEGTLGDFVAPRYVVDVDKSSPNPKIF